MMKKISVAAVTTQLGQIIDSAVGRNERFLVERDGEPAVLILSVSDFVKTLAPPPDWLTEIQEESRQKGLDKLTMTEIDGEIEAARRERRRG